MTRASRQTNDAQLRQQAAVGVRARAATSVGDAVPEVMVPHGAVMTCAVLYAAGRRARPTELLMV